MSKVLLIGPNFHYFIQCIKHGLETNGCDVEVEMYDDPIHPYNALNMLRYKFAQDKDKAKLHSRKAWKSYIEQRWMSINPDIVFVVNGSNLMPESVELFATKSKVAFWLFDSITRFTYLVENLSFAHNVFCYEKGDIPILKEKYGIDASFLSQAVDTTLYYPLPTEKKYDIAFAGDIFHSEKRQRLLNALVNAFPDKKLCFYGIAVPWYKGVWKWLTRKHRDIYVNRNGFCFELNSLYNASRVVLNIHIEQQTDGANPKVYEIAATGAYQICDRNDYIEKLFPNGEIGLYSNEEELISCISNALEAESLNGDAAYKLVTTGHTFEVRMKEMLSKIQQE